MAKAKNLCSCLLFIIVHYLLFSLKPKGTHAMNAINSNESLSGDQTLTSKNGTFVLGFFKPGNSSNRYIGIWYGTLPVEQTIVWVANRETPITDSTMSKLMISEDGNLVLLNQFKTVVWSTNVKNIKSSSTEAIIFDDGNFVLRDKYNSSLVLWESFDHPTDTSLPGSKLGLNKITGVNQRLVSWKNNNDPAPGLFSYEIDPETNELAVYWNNSVQYWTSGKWNGQYFEAIPEMEMYTHLNIISYSFVDNETGTYLIYWFNRSLVATARMVMDISGQVISFSWKKGTEVWATTIALPTAQCDVYNLCGPFGICNDNFRDTCNCIKGFTEQYPTNWGLGDYSGGCMRRTTLNCNQNGSGKRDEDRFYEMSDMILPDHSWRINGSDIKDCEIACLNNCSCTAYSYSNACYLWYGELFNLKNGDGHGGETIYLRLAASELPAPKGKNKILIGVVVVGVFLVAYSAFLLFSITKKKWRLRRLRRIDGRIIAFTYSDLVYITKNFSEALGRGGFGSVFKGILPDSTTVAVKRLHGICQSDENFRAEVSTIGTIQHLNLIQLIGFCSEQDKKLLVYEHMPMGSLDKHLFGKSSSHLSWSTRYQIALGIARGLHYLHEECRDCIIHCDIKPENVLLDESLVPKIADFGLAKLLGRDFSRVLTSMRGTIGYLAPEWIAGTTITTKADVYSYGMMLFEIIFGKRNRVQEEEADEHFFPAFAAKKLVDGDILCLVDSKFIDDTDTEELETVLKIALWCIQVEEDQRPTIGQVIQMLEGVSNVSMPPVPTSFQVFSETPYSLKYFSSASSKRSLEV